jgi:hypothetical protein
MEGDVRSFERELERMQPHQRQGCDWAFILGWIGLLLFLGGFWYGVGWLVKDVIQ